MSKNFVLAKSLKIVELCKSDESKSFLLLPLVKCLANLCDGSREGKKSFEKCNGWEKLMFKNNPRIFQSMSVSFSFRPSFAGVVDRYVSGKSRIAHSCERFIEKCFP